MSSHHEKSLLASDFLKKNIGLLPKGRVLDLAMGNGRNAVYLAGLGFEVEGVDISGEAVQKAIESASESGVKINAIKADLEREYRIPEHSFDVIICFNYLQRTLIPQIKSGLRSGGFLVYETFIIDQAGFGRPKNPDYLLRHNELLEMFRDFICIRYHEGIVDNRKAVAGIIAIKP